MAKQQISGLQLKTIPARIQVDTTNGALAGMKVFAGRGKITATTGTDAAEGVTFPSAFTAPPIVVCQYMGYANAGAAWTDYPNDSWGGMTFSAQNPGLTSFTARGRRNDGATLGGDYYYSWIAIGV